MQWSIQDLGAIGEFVGAFAVVVTLIYLTLQVRQSTVQARLELFSDNLESVVTRELALLGETPELSMSRVLFDPQTATRKDYFVVDRVYSATLFQLRRAMLFADAGFYGTNENVINARGFVKLNYQIFASPYGLAWLDQAAEDWGPTGEVRENLLFMRELASRQTAVEHMSNRMNRAESLAEKVEELTQ